MTYKVLLKALDALEKRESRLLTWGVTGINLSRAEVRECLRADVPEADFDNLLGQLEAESLLLPLDREGAQFRTRTAENLRLLHSVRQWFGGGRNGEARSVISNDRRQVDPQDTRTWPAARHLVSDFRFRAEPRRVPRRDVSRESVVAEVAEVAAIPHSLVEALRQLMPSMVSRFQRDSLRTILGWRGAGQDRAAVVTAGTGAGKTYAFYVPVLADLFAGPGASKCPTVLAVYPRTELLKDQLQGAFALCRKVDPLAGKLGRRPLRVGALFADVPEKPAWVDGGQRSQGWKRTQGGHICPFLRCTKINIDGRDCSSDLEWRTVDRNQGSQRLRCTKASCGHVIDDGLVVLTREGLRQAPPDVLFLSMEMLNRYLQESGRESVIGGRQAAPRYVLLDEIHTYGGVSGAQNAYVLKRWRQRVRGPERIVNWVGLSATLQRPADFFRQLIPIKNSSEVEHVAPHDADVDQVGKSYSVVLRGDPSSQAALLAVTIQSLMLLARSCCAARNPSVDNRSMVPGEWQKRVFGHKVFAFTDTLDVFSRLEGDLSDAERKHLAWLRASTSDSLDEKTARLGAGQWWRLAERLGRNLGESIQVRSLSSKWQQQIATADVVIATSSLEVGYDDDEVNVVLQHKAPRDWASYLQRIGRAGRKIEMRPWAVTVLSDYGRDGQAYRNYHEFFEPALRYQPVPIDNTYVLRIQAVHATLDLLAERASSRTAGGAGLQWGESVTQFLARWDKRSDDDRRVVRKVVERLLEDPVDYQKQLEYRLQRRTNDRLLQDALYRPPRSLLYEFLPTLLRQLRGHRMPAEIGRERAFSHFVPRALFQQLGFPEVECVVDGDEEGAESLDMPIAVSEFAPLNVSKRFSRQGPDAPGHWMAPSDLLARVQRAVQEAGGGIPTVVLHVEELGQFDVEHSSLVDADAPRVYRPRRIQLAVVTDFSDRTQSRLDWDTHLLAHALEEGEGVEDACRILPEHASVARLVRRLDFALHARGLPLTIRRFARSATCTLKASARAMQQHGLVPDQQVQLRFEDGEEGEAAIGFELDADAVGLRVPADAFGEDGWLARDVSAEAIRRTDFFQARFRAEWDGRVIGGQVCLNVFVLDRLSSLFLAIVGEDCLRSGRTVEQRVKIYRERPDELSDALHRIRMFAFGRVAPENHQVVATELATSLERLIDHSPLMQALLQHASILYEDLAEAAWASDLQAWVEERAMLALGATFLSAVSSILPDLDCESLAVDVHRPGASVNAGEGQLGTVWISETTPGGVGTIQQVLEAYTANEEQFLASWLEAVRPTGQESVAEDLQEVVVQLNRDSALAKAAGRFRKASSILEQENAVRGLQHAVEELGIPWRHGLRVPLVSRLLTDGTTTTIDKWLQALLEARQKAASTLPFELPDLGLLRLVCRDEDGVMRQGFDSGQHPWQSAWREMVQADVEEGYRQAWMRLHLSSMLWEPARRQAERELSVYNRYRPQGAPDIAALRGALVKPPEVCVEARQTAEAWWQELNEAIAKSPAEVHLCVGPGGRRDLARALAHVATSEVDYELTRSYLRVRAVRRDARGWYASVQVMEFVR